MQRDRWSTPGKARRHRSSSDGRDRWQPWRRVESSGAPDPHRTISVAIEIIIAIVFHRTEDVPRNLSPRDRAIVAIRSPEASSDGRRNTTKNDDRGPIVTLADGTTLRDRSSIVPRLDLLSSRNHPNLRRRRPTEIQVHDRR